MAHEPNMKPDSAARALHTHADWSSLTVLSDQRLLSNLGTKLRNVYGDVTESDQPSDLVRLAALIDANRTRSAR